MPNDKEYTPSSSGYFTDAEGHILDSEGNRILDDRGNPVQAPEIEPHYSAPDMEMQGFHPEGAVPHGVVSSGRGEFSIDTEGRMVDSQGRVLDERAQPEPSNAQPSEERSFWGRITDAFRDFNARLNGENEGGHKEAHLKMQEHSRNPAYGAELARDSMGPGYAASGQDRGPWNSPEYLSGASSAYRDSIGASYASPEQVRSPWNNPEYRSEASRDYGVYVAAPEGRGFYSTESQGHIIDSRGNTVELNEQKEPSLEERLEAAAKEAMGRYYNHEDIPEPEAHETPEPTPEINPIPDEPDKDFYPGM